VVDLDRETLAAIRAASEADLFSFAKGILGYDRLVERIHGPVCAALADEGIPRLNVLQPRSTYKSTVATISYPLWKALQVPEWTSLIGFNTEKNAKSKLREIKQHVERNTLLRALWPERMPDFHQTTWGALEASLRRDQVTSGTPTWVAAGLTTKVVSHHFHEIIMDDLVTPDVDDITEEAVIPDNQTLAMAAAWYRGTRSLFNDPKVNRLINVGTRGGLKDLYSIVMANPAFAAHSLEYRAEDEAGNVLMPEMFDRRLLDEIKAEMGTTLYALWYLNVPIDTTELVFNPQDENFYEEAPSPEGLRVYSAIDVAASTSKDADNTAIVTVGVDGAGQCLVLDEQYGRWEPMETIQRLFWVQRTFRPISVGVEKAAFQVFFVKILPYFEQEMGERLNIREMTRGSSKELRILRLQPYVENRRLKFPRGGAKNLLREMRDFRMSQRRRGHDDALDACADACQLAGLGGAVRTEAPAERARRRWTADEVAQWWRRERMDPEKAIAREVAAAEGGPADGQMRARRYHYLERAGSS